MLILLLEIIVLYLIWSKFPRSRIIMLFPLFGCLLALISSYYLDQGVNSIELNQTTYRNNSGLIYFFLILPIILVQGQEFNKQLKWDINWKTNLLVLCILSLLIINYIVSPKPYFSSVDRIHYWENSKFPFLRSFFGSSASFVPFYAGLIFAIKRSKFAVFLLIIYILYILGLGQKGGSLIQTLLYFCYPISTCMRFQIRAWKVVFLAFISGITVIYIAYLNYSFYNPYSYIGLQPFEAVIYRLFALQNGMTWYAVENYVNHFGSYEFYDLLNGMSSVMSDIVDGEISYEYTQRNGRFTNGFPANVLKFSPILSPVMVLLMMSFLRFNFHLFRSLLRQSAILGSMAFNALMLVQINITMGDWYQSVKWGILLFLLFFGYEAIHTRRFNGRP